MTERWNDKWPWLRPNSLTIKNIPPSVTEEEIKKCCYSVLFRAPAVRLNLVSSENLLVQATEKLSTHEEKLESFKKAMIRKYSHLIDEDEDEDEIISLIQDASFGESEEMSSEQNKELKAEKKSAKLYIPKQKEYLKEVSKKEIRVSKMQDELKTAEKWDSALVEPIISSLGSASSKRVVYVQFKTDKEFSLARSRFDSWISSKSGASDIDSAPILHGETFESAKPIESVDNNIAKKTTDLIVRIDKQHMNM